MEKYQKKTYINIYRVILQTPVDRFIFDYKFNYE